MTRMSSLALALLVTACATDDLDDLTESSNPLAAAPWLYDTFDDLPIGPLAGQAGWQLVAPDDQSPTVFPQDGHGNAVRMRVTPGSGGRIGITKSVPPQTGRQRMAFLFRANLQVTSPSKAKLQVLTPGGFKAQVYIGNGARVNVGAATQELFTPEHPIVLGAWYRVDLELDLDTNQLEVSIADEAAKPFNRVYFTMPPGPITGVTLFSWDQPGAAFFDNLIGVAAL